MIFLLPLAFVYLTLPENIEAQRDSDPCRLFANGTKIRHPHNCSQEVVCINFKSLNGTGCSGSKPFYNKDTNKCDTQLTDDSSCAIDCTNMIAKFVKDPKSCYGYYYCENENLALYGHCPNNLHFNQTLQACIDTYSSECRLNTLDFCAIVSKGVKFRDEYHCGKYYECAENKTTKVVTLKNEYCAAKKRSFDAVKGDCVEETIKGCYPVPANACVVDKKIKKNYFINDGVTCAGIFYCADVGGKADPNPQWYRCPDNKFFSQATQKCLDPLEVICVKDRCEGSNRPFVVSSEKGCRKYLICKNGVKVGEGTCGNSFFDELHGQCTPEIMKFPACYHK